jgi:hypothetical protein
MKLGTAILLAVLGGCAAARKAGPEPSAVDVRGSADDLRVVHEYRPAPTGSEVLAVSYDHPPRTYYADCWRRQACYPAYRWNPPCERPRYSRRCD